MILAHKIQLRPTKAQIAYFRNACGASRFVWNWGVAEWERQYQMGQKPSGLSLKRYFNTIYKAQFPWINETHRDCHSQPFANLHKAMLSFFKKRGGKPHFKKRGKCRDSFYVANDKFHVENKVVILPKIGRVRLTEKLRFDGKIQGAVVSRSADRWFISIQVDTKFLIKPKTGCANIGVDLGVKTSVVCSDGTIYQSPKPLHQRLRQLARLQRSVSRKVKGSKNRRKAVDRAAKLHWKIANIRRDFLHKTTTSIVRKSHAIAIEDLSVAGMMKNHWLAKAIAEQGFSALGRQFEYKTKVYAVDLLTADRFFPSSKMCCICGNIKVDLQLSYRVYICAVCGSELDRDFNSAKNLENLLPSARGKVKPVDCQIIPDVMGGSAKQEHLACSQLST